AWPWTCFRWSEADCSQLIRWRAPDMLVRLRAGLPHLLGRIRAQIAEELLDFTGQRLGGGRQFAGCGEDGGRGRARRADGVAERADVDDQRSVALRCQLRVRRYFAGRRILLLDRAGDDRGHLVDLAHGVADFADRSASALTSWATTAKPRPASPARAASIVALSARRLVCSAIAWIRLSTPSMRWVAAARPSISATDLSVRWPACSTTLADWRTWRPISSTEAESSSAALATAETLLEAC